jgi:hypothetical protein
LYGAFVWARRALNGRKRRFPARAVKKHKQKRAIDRRFDGPKHLRTRNFDDSDDYDDYGDDY